MKTCFGEKGGKDRWHSHNTEAQGDSKSTLFPRGSDAERNGRSEVLLQGYLEKNEDNGWINSQIDIDESRVYCTG